MTSFDLLPLPLNEQATLDGKADKVKAEFFVSLHDQVKKNIEERTKEYAKYAKGAGVS